MRHGLYRVRLHQKLGRSYIDLTSVLPCDNGKIAGNRRVFLKLPLLRLREARGIKNSPLNIRGVKGVMKERPLVLRWNLWKI